MSQPASHNLITSRLLDSSPATGQPANCDVINAMHKSVLILAASLLERDVQELRNDPSRTGLQHHQFACDNAAASKRCRRRISPARLSRFAIADSTGHDIHRSLDARIVGSLPPRYSAVTLSVTAEPWGIYDHIKRYLGCPRHNIADFQICLRTLGERSLDPAEQKVELHQLLIESGRKYSPKMYSHLPLEAK